MRAHCRTFALLGFGIGSLVLACSSSDGSGEPAGAGAGNPSGGATPGGGASSGGAIPGGGAAGAAGVPVSGAGTSAQGGASAGGAAGASAGGPGGGAAGAAPSAGSGGVDPGDTPPPRPLNVTVGGMKQITHKGVAGLTSAGLDTRAKQLGKLVVDLSVSSGDYQPWLGKRGFHSIGVQFPMCGAINDWKQGRDYDGDCRLNTFDGMPHGNQSAVKQADSMAAHITSGLTALAAQFPTEDWGYFLNADGSVRWSDVAFTGMSHGATTAPVIGKAVRLYRVVSRSGPRDNTCGLAGQAKGDFSRATPPWDVPCMDSEVASWLDAPSATPVNRFFAFVGKQDVEYGDIMYAMERMKYPGEPVRWDVAGTLLTSTNRFYADAGHLDFMTAAMRPDRTDDALEIAFGVPEANRHPTF